MEGVLRERQGVSGGSRVSISATISIKIPIIKTKLLKI